MQAMLAQHAALFVNSKQQNVRVLHAVRVSALHRLRERQSELQIGRAVGKRQQRFFLLSLGVS
jgi:hypothetical protein